VETPHPRKEGLITTNLRLTREILRIHAVVPLVDVVTHLPEVLRGLAHLPTTKIIPGMIDLNRDNLLGEEVMEEAVPQTETHPNG
jgi:hypothetical protein